MYGRTGRILHSKLGTQVPRTCLQRYMSDSRRYIKNMSEALSICLLMTYMYLRYNCTGTKFSTGSRDTKAKFCLPLRRHEHRYLLVARSRY
eukprot:SAG31_NODE_943_length_10852_cov_22.874454_5_plen_91_part_00